ncbi:hypothetical protein AAG570_009401, partial [Ranatra chinensis]
VLERDCNDEILWTWTYPSVTDKQKAVILQKCTFSIPNSFIFWHRYNNWFYITYTDANNEHLPSVKQFAIILRTKDLDTEKYEKLSRIMSKAYLESGSPTTLLQLYLNVATKEVCTSKENGTFLVRECELMATFILDVIKLFGLEIIVIYTVLLLKKRLVIYHHSLQTLLQVRFYFLFLNLLGLLSRKCINCLFIVLVDPVISFIHGPS